MSTLISNRTARVKPSATMAVNAKAQELKRAGVDIINLSVGEPDFPTPQAVKQAAIDAINANQTRYTPIDGTPELKSAIITKLKQDNALDYNANEIIVTCGAKQALYNIAQALLNEGDEAIIPAPFWVSYSAIVELAEGIPVIVVCDHTQNFKLSADQLAQAITTKTKLFFLNSPSNPTGMYYNLNELKALGDVLRQHPNIVIVADDIYEYIFWGDKKFSTFLNANPDLRERTIVVNGVSKAYAMTGWRIGYSAAPEHITKPMKIVQSHSTSCACSISQAAATTALQLPRHDLQPMYDQFKKRHDLVVSGLRQIKGIEIKEAHGAFYVYPYVQTSIDKLGFEDDIELANYLLEEAHVATVPGTAFGTPGYLRISCATSDELLSEAINRLQKAL